MTVAQATVLYSTILWIIRLCVGILIDIVFSAVRLPSI